MRKGVRFAPQGPVDERESGRAAGFENIPAVVAAAASLRAVRAEAAGEAVRLRELTERIRARVPVLVPDVDVVGDPVAPSARHRHLLLSPCRRGDIAARARPGGFLGVVGLVVHEQHADAEPCAEGDGGAQRGQRPRRSCPSAPRPRRSTGSSRCCRTRSPVCARSSARRPPGRPGRRTPWSSTPGQALPDPRDRAGEGLRGRVRRWHVRVLSDDEAARLDIPAWCEMRGQEYVGEEPAERGSAYVVRRLS